MFVLVERLRALLFRPKAYLACPTTDITAAAMPANAAGDVNGDFQKLDASPTDVKITPDVRQKRSRGVYLSKPLLVTLLIFILLCLIAVGVAVYFATRSLLAELSSPSTEQGATTVASTEAPEPQLTEADIRLPTHLYPLAYRLSIRPYFPSPKNLASYAESKNFTFDGYVEIDVVCRNATSTVTLHANKIDILSHEITSANGVNIALGSYKNDSKTHKVFFDTKEPVVPGQTYTVKINYIGYLNDDMAGFYRSSYWEDDQLRWLAITQFESVDARRALPCFDEPAFKAVFSLTLTHSSDMIAISNAKEKLIRQREDLPGWTETTFEPTPKMSTYLLAFAVAAFEKIEATANTEQKTLFRIWARPQLKETLDYAKFAGPVILENYERYFNVTFPLGKQDMMAVPDFAAGAMENWGLVTYRETDLLYDEKHYSPSAKQRVAKVIGHELAHQWFGNLVTMKWWDDLWLNEGFASQIEYFGTDCVEKEFKVFDQAVREIQSSMDYDQHGSSHPISVAVLTEDEIAEIFDPITYDKAGCVLTMVRHLLGDSVWRQGLLEYLTKFIYGNAEHADLSAALTKTVQASSHPVKDWNNKPLDVAEFLNPWILQMGFPAVFVKSKNSATLLLTQSRFKINDTSEDNPKYPSPFNYTWPIPIWYKEVPSGQEELLWLRPNEELEIVLRDPSAFPVLNIEVRGLYRVSYDDNHWLKLSQMLQKNHTVFPVKNRAQFMDDALNLARAGKIGYGTAMSMTCYLKNELNFLPWFSTTNTFDLFKAMFVLNDKYQEFKEFMVNLIEPLYKKLGWEDTHDPNDVLTHSLRNTILGWACEVEVKDCVIRSKKLLAEFLQKCNTSFGRTCDANPITANLRSVVYCYGVAHSDSNSWEMLWELYKKEPLAREKVNMLSGLTCTKEPRILLRLMDELVYGTNIKPMDMRAFSSYIGQNPVAMLFMWTYIQTNWHKIVEKFSHLSMSSLKALIISATRSFTVERQLEMVKSFVDHHKAELGLSVAAFQQVIETIQSNVVWFKDNGQVLEKWFRENKHGC